MIIFARVEGRQCDHCSYGSYGYPDCEACDCDLRGTTERICDQSNAECFCKENVIQGDGSRCDTCKDGHFNLQESNPDGCMECFCFGKTQFCSSNTKLQKTKVSKISNKRIFKIFNFRFLTWKNGWELHSPLITEWLRRKKFCNNPLLIMEEPWIIN